eukprot:459330-Pleurochrysis_carterae.AAC.1
MHRPFCCIAQLSRIDDPRATGMADDVTRALATCLGVCDCGARQPTCTKEDKEDKRTKLST